MSNSLELAISSLFQSTHRTMYDFHFQYFTFHEHSLRSVNTNSQLAAEKTFSNFPTVFTSIFIANSGLILDSGKSDLIILSRANYFPEFIL